MSAARRNARAAVNAVKLPEQKAAKKALEGVPQTRAARPAKEPSPRPYREPEPVPKAKRVVRAVSDRDGVNLLCRIQNKGGRDLIVMMRDSKRAPQELAESLMRDETVISSLNAYGSNKDPLQRLIVAIKQAPGYLENDGRPVTTGVKKQKKQLEVQLTRAELARNKKKPRVREHLAPTLAEVVPQRDDQQIVLEELRQYLGLNAELSRLFMSTVSDQRAGRILVTDVGTKFDAKVKALLAVPSAYEQLLTEAGVIIRREVRQNKVASAVMLDPTPAAQESPEVNTRFQSLLASWDARQKPVEPDPDDPEALEQQAIFDRQEAALQRFVALD